MTDTVKNGIFSLILLFGIGVTSLAIAEFAFHILLNNPMVLQNSKLLDHFRLFYSTSDRKIIQYDPDCAEYDPTLTYRLKPGECHIENREFKIKYRVNTLGVRDDELSLEDPEIVVIGDSHAMGWGVRQDRTFPERLETLLGARVLNTAISSYGTAREMVMLGKADTSSMRALVIQYCENDFWENAAYYDNENSLEISTKTKYIQTIDRHGKDVSYYFGKYVAYFVSIIRQSFIEQEAPERALTGSERDLLEARRFLNTIINAPVNLDHVPILVMEINGYGKNDSRFIRALRKEVKRLSMYASIRNIRLLDLSTALEDSHYYRLDDHMRAEGHDVVARLISKEIKNLTQSGDF